jgi:arylsulfatase A-like enzyme
MASKLPLLFLLLLTAFSPAQRSPNTSSKPNILVILADDLGYGDLSSYGAPDLKTPHIDALVKAGMRFNQFYANSSVCSPTRAALLSGKYPERVGVPGVIRTHAANSWGYLAPKAVLLPSLLQEGGYHTALVGKWHLGLEEPNLPNDRGFDHFHGFAGDMMDDYYTHLRHNINYMRLNWQEINPQGHATDLFTQWAGDYLRDRAKKQEPFFLYLAYNAPHDPIQPPAEWVEKVKKRQPGMDEKRAKLAALIEHMDAGIGQVMQTLRQTGLARNTLVIFTSDNGGKLLDGANNGPLRGGKGSVYEGGLKVPAVAVWPGQIKPGTISGQQALVMDIFPTVLEAAGLTIAHPIDGQSFLPALLGRSQPAPSEERPVFFIRREGGDGHNGKTTDAVRLGDWKLLQNSAETPRELYNLRQDPLEQHNLAKERPEEFRKLEQLMRDHIRLGGAVPWQKPE